VDEWAEVRRLHFGEHLGVKTIARRLGLARNTVRSAIRSTAPPKYERQSRGSAVDEYERRIRQLLTEHPQMPASVIAERVGWSRGATVFRQRVAALRPLYGLQEPYQRTEYRPGELAQWDLWFPPVDIPVGAGVTARLPVLVGALGYSRLSGGEMIRRARPKI
jgi:transposase